MIESTAERVTVTHPTAGWSAVHLRNILGAPCELLCANTPVARPGAFYVDTADAALTVLERNRVFRRGGMAVADSRGRFASGLACRFRHAVRYAGCHYRASLELAWARGDLVQRHFGLGDLYLPGTWTRWYCVPPATHLAEGTLPHWQEIPSAADSKTMVGHWHRPPLALVFERADGVRFEIGTGDDVWRWEQCLGSGPENGSYKVFVDSDGVQVVREPLMCCAPYAVPPREYRWTWYVAWDDVRTVGCTDSPGCPEQLEPLTFADGRDLVLPPATVQPRDSAFLLDFARVQWDPGWCRAVTPIGFVRGLRSGSPCLRCAPVQKRIRRVIRQISSWRNSGRLHLTGLTPGVCWDSAHLDRGRQEGLVHWDMSALLDFAVWARRQLGPDWHITIDVDAFQPMPSAVSLFKPNGFDVCTADEP